MTMEEAIKTANSGLAYLCDKGGLPRALVENDFTQTNGFNVRDQRVVPTEVRPDPAYSLWLVNLPTAKFR